MFIPFLEEFPGGVAVKAQGLGIVTAVAKVQSLAQELLHAMGVAKKKKKKILLLE